MAPRIEASLMREEGYLSVSEAAALLGLCAMSLRRLAHSGKVRSLQRERGRTGSPIYLLVDDLLEYFGGGTDAGRALYIRRLGAVRRDPGATTAHWCPTETAIEMTAPAPAPRALGKAPQRRRR